MVSAAGMRKRLDGIDGKWVAKFALLVTNILLCVIAVFVAALVASYTSDFQPVAWQSDWIVLYYLPVIALTILFTIYFCISTVRNAEYPNLILISLVHFFMTLAYSVAAGYCMSVVITARQQLETDPYGVQNPGQRAYNAPNGTMVAVTSSNVATCPAFSNCAAQQAWISNAMARSTIALIGCGVITLIAVMHLILSVISMMDGALGTHAKGWEKQEEETAESRRSRMRRNLSDLSIATATTIKSSIRAPRVVSIREERLKVPEQRRSKLVVSPSFFADRIWGGERLDLSFKFPNKEPKAEVAEKQWPLKDGGT